jgi:hypothetical protein
MIISTMRQHHGVRVGLPNPRHRIGTDRPDGRYVGSFDGNDEKNCPGGRCGARWRATRILVLLRARSAEKRSGTGTTSRQLQEKVGGVAPAGPFSLGGRATGGVSDSEHTRRRLGARSANRWGSYEINRSYLEAVRLLMLWTAPPPARECHGCGGC